MSQAFDDLKKTFAALRHPETGCPWDLEQTHESLTPYLIEEAYEVIEALEHGEAGELKDELGDLLLQIIFHAQLADEAGRFNLDEIATNLNDKLIRRHPHVFSDQHCADAEAVEKNWDAIKKSEKAAQTSALDGVVKHLPATMYAQKLQRRAAKVGFDWPDHHGIVDKVHEELGELQTEIEDRKADRIEDELGDLLFTVVNLGRFLKIDCENALRKSANKFERRFRSVEAKAAADKRKVTDCDTELLDRYWREIKAEEP